MLKLQSHYLILSVSPIAREQAERLDQPRDLDLERPTLRAAAGGVGENYSGQRTKRAVLWQIFQNVLLNQVTVCLCIVVIAYLYCK